MDEENQLVNNESAPEDLDSVNKNPENEEIESQLPDIVSNSSSSNGIDKGTLQVESDKVDCQSQRNLEKCQPQDKDSLLLKQAVTDCQSEEQTLNEIQPIEELIDKNQSIDQTFRASQLPENMNKSQTITENELKDQTIFVNSKSSEVISEINLTKLSSKDKICVDNLLDNQNIYDKGSDSITNLQIISNEIIEEGTVIRLKNILESENSSISVKTLVPDLSKESSENVSSIDSSVEINTESELVSKNLDDEKPDNKNESVISGKESTEKKNESIVIPSFEEMPVNVDKVDLKEFEKSSVIINLKNPEESSVNDDGQKSKDSSFGGSFEKYRELPFSVDSEKLCQEEESQDKPNSPFENNKELNKQDESLSSQSNINTSTDEDNLNKSETEGNELADTEVINCNEIEQVDLNESDCPKDKDTIGSENEPKNESKEEIDALESADEKCDDPKTQKEDLNEFESVIEECTDKEDTISAHEGTLGSKKHKSDSFMTTHITSRLTRSERLRSNKSIEEEKIKETPKSLKKRRKAEGKKNDSKDRPMRSAAKLAENKIKSLVERDYVLEEHLENVVVMEDYEFHENMDETNKICVQCKEEKMCKFIIIQGDTTQYICSEQCSIAYKEGVDIKPEQEVSEAETEEFVRKCAQCRAQIEMLDKRLYWETMDFCNEDCLGKYQSELGSCCANCKGTVASSSLGKYCVRFGYDVKQFCSANCLEEYKKGLKVCSYCQKDISIGPEGFLAPVGDKGQFKDFCTQSCMEKYERMSSNVPPPDVIEKCAVCSNSKPVRVEVELDNKTHKLCSEPCFAAFKFVKNIKEGQCDMCRKYFDRLKTGHFNLYYDESPHSFCCKTCMNVYILAHRKIVPCNWCKVKKYNFDMIKKVNANGQLTMMCSLNCLMLYQVSANSVSSRRIKCDFCLSVTQVQYHLTMSDASVRNFCSYNCVLSFQVTKKKLDVSFGEVFASVAKELYTIQHHNEYPQQAVDIIAVSNDQIGTTPTGTSQKRIAPRRSQQVETSCVPVISSVQSLAAPNGPASPARVQISRADVSMVTQVATPLTMPATVTPVPAPPPPPPQIYQQIITKPPEAKQMKNKSVLCKPYSHTKGVSCRPHPCMKETQTDQSLNRKFLIPVPVPIFVPAPMHMFATPFPVPVPFPLPVPVPVFIPTTRNSAKGIMKEIKRIQEKIPTDPFEAELLMMAEMVAGDKKQDPTDSESDDGNDGDDGGDGTFSPENVDTSNTFGDDMLQMALKMASELEEPAVDMESVLTSNTITTSTQPQVDPNKALYASEADQVNVMAMGRGRKRSVRGSRNNSGGTPSKRGRRTSGSVDVPLLPPPEPVPPPRIEVEKPDANMCLKYTFGVNAWRHWVIQKNAELEKAAMTNRKIKLFKPELLQLTADELNFSLCLFVKEVRKPNGTEYAPDTIYYLCLGIQQYLFENGRIDNIFTDSYYEKFTDCLDEVAKKFAALYNDSQYIVTRVEEEHLWESKQLGAHSPHVLLSTLMFFNTKHFNLVTVEEHMQLSFSHIMKHWKRNPNTPGVAKVPGSRNVLLRFYPPQSALEANSRKKKVYEQQENEENPLRCPVKLYEFYLSKCPESVKTRNDVFYLLPERSCVPDSPVWYSTMALGKEPLMKMLHRVKMVKEINIALLSC